MIQVGSSTITTVAVTDTGTATITTTANGIYGNLVGEVLAKLVKCLFFMVEGVFLLPHLYLLHRNCLVVNERVFAQPTVCFFFLVDVSGCNNEVS